jgi:polyisoprenoid-binding protein YceI
MPWIAVALLLAAAPAVGRGDSARVYDVVADQSSVTIHVDKTGLLKGFGHEHDVVAKAMSGRVELDSMDPARSRVSVIFEAPSLRVVPDREPPKDVAKVQETMLGPEVLDVARHPKIRFTSRACTVKTMSGGAADVVLTGDLDLHGVVRAVTLPITVELAADHLVTRGSAVLRQTDFAIEPVSVAGGGVKVADEVTVRFSVFARAVHE